MNTKQLRDAFAAKTSELGSLLEKGNDITAEDYAKIQGLNTEVEGLQGQIRDAGEQEKALAEMRVKNGQRVLETQRVHSPVPHAGVAGTGDGNTPAYLLKSGEAHLSANELIFDGQGGISQKQLQAISTRDYAESFMQYLKGGIHACSSLQVKTLQEGSDTAGGFTVPEQVLARLIMKKPTPTRVAGNCSRLTTGRDHLTLPRVNYSTDNLYTTGIRVTFTGEIPAASTTARVTDPIFGQHRIPIWTAMLSCPVTQDVIEDSMFGLADFLSSKFRETIDLLYDNMVLNGTGLGQPAGILVNPGGTDEPSSTNMGNPVTADNIVNLAWSIPEQYEENVKWVFNKTNMGQYIATLKDQNLRYIWGMGYNESGLDAQYIRRNLLGYPVLFSGFMPNRGANNYPIMIGDFSGYSLVERVGLSIQVLNEVYAEVNQKVLLGRIRFGGLTTEAWKMYPGKQA